MLMHKKGTELARGETRLASHRAAAAAGSMTREPREIEIPFDSCNLLFMSDDSCTLN